MADCWIFSADVLKQDWEDTAFEDDASCEVDIVFFSFEEAIATIAEEADASCVDIAEDDDKIFLSVEEAIDIIAEAEADASCVDIAEEDDNMFFSVEEAIIAEEADW